MPPLPTFSAYHDALMAKLDELNTSIQGITTAVQGNTVAVQAVQAEVAALKGTPGKTMQDIYDKIDSSTADLTQVEASLNNIDNLLGILTSSTDNPAYAQINDLADLLKILMNPAGHTDYFNLHELRIAITGQTFVDAVETESYAPTIEGIIKKLTNLQGTPTSSREGLVDNRTDLRNIFDALSGPPVVGTEDPVNWWDEVQDMISLASNGIDIATDLYDFFNRAAGTAAQAATAGTTGATAIGQWITAMALAVIAMQMTNAQGTRVLIKQNTDDIKANSDTLINDVPETGKINLYSLYERLGLTNGELGYIRGELGYIRGHTGIIPIIASETQQTGYTNLKDLDITLDFILSELNMLMNYPNRVNLASILEALVCICPWLARISQNTEALAYLDHGNAPLLEDPLDSSGPATRHCERSYWLMFELLDILRAFNRNENHITISEVRDIYHKNFVTKTKSGFQTYLTDEAAKRISLRVNRVLRINADFRLEPLINAITNDAGVWDDLQNAIYSAASASAALSNWVAAIEGWDAYNVYITHDERELLKAVLPAGLLNEVFAGHIPLDQSELDDYSSDCSGLGGGGDPGGGDLDPEWCAESEVGGTFGCGRKTINGYTYAIYYVRSHAAWSAQRTGRTSNDYWVAGSCSGYWTSNAFLTHPDMQTFRARITQGYNDLVSEGCTVFWMNDPQSDVDVEAAAAANALTDNWSTIGSATTRFALAVKYNPTTTPIPPSTLVRLCPPDI
jgi:hypothetical protein